MYECLILGLRKPFHASLSAQSASDQMKQAGYSGCCIFKTNFTRMTLYIMKGEHEENHFYFDSTFGELSNLCHKYKLKANVLLSHPLLVSCLNARC